MAVTTPPSWTSSAGTPARTAYSPITAPRPSPGGPPVSFQYVSAESDLTTTGTSPASDSGVDGGHRAS